MNSRQCMSNDEIRFVLQTIVECLYSINSTPSQETYKKLSIDLQKTRELVYKNE